MSGSTIGPEHTPLLQTSTTSTRLTISNPTLPSTKKTRPSGFWPILKDQMSFAGKIAFAPIGLMAYAGADLNSEITALIKNRQASNKISKELQSLKPQTEEFASYEKAKRSLKLAEQKQKHAEQVYEGYKKINKDDLSKIPSWISKAKHTADNELSEAKRAFKTVSDSMNLDEELLKKEKELEELNNSFIKGVGEIINATSDVFVGALSLPAEPLLLLFGGALAMRAFANASLSAASNKR